MNDAPRPSGSEQPNRGPDSERLLSLLETAREGSRELDIAIGKAIGKIPVEWLDDFMPADIPQYSRSLDAALSLCPERGDKGLLWRIILERKPVHTGPSWIAEVREHARSGGDAIAHTAALALCAAALRANAAKPKSAASISPPPDRGASPQESLPESNNQSETP